MNSNILVALCFGLAGVCCMVAVERFAMERHIRRSARRQAGMRGAVLPKQEFLANRQAILFIVGVAFVSIVSMSFVGPAGIALGAVPLVMQRSRTRQRKEKRSDDLSAELGPAIQLIIGHLRIGRNVVAAVIEVADATPEPLGSILREVVAETRVGASIDEALQRVAEHEDNRHLNVVASALGLQARHGGSLVEILETVVETIEEEDRLRRDIKALTADGRLSGIVLMAMPPVMLVLVSLFSPGYAAPLVQEPLGRAMSIVGVVLAFTGWRWLKVLGTPKVVA